MERDDLKSFQKSNVEIESILQRVTMFSNGIQNRKMCHVGDGQITAGVNRMELHQGIIKLSGI